MITQLFIVKEGESLREAQVRLIASGPRTAAADIEAIEAWVDSHGEEARSLGDLVIADPRGRLETYCSLYPILLIPAVAIDRKGTVYKGGRIDFDVPARPRQEGGALALLAIAPFDS